LDKAPDAFRTISEVAEEINVPQHVLRFWESRFAQIKPMKRGGGRRYYRPDDVDLLRGVRHLLYGEGYTIRGVQRILRDEGIAFVQGVWRADSAPPPPPDVEDLAEDAEAPVETARRAEPAFFGLQPARAEAGLTDEPARREPTLMPPPESSATARRFDGDDRRKLQTVLDDLIACRRLIDAALTDDGSSESTVKSAAF
jgi:DNA-binding transcriptional MerR regulator